MCVSVCETFRHQIAVIKQSLSVHIKRATVSFILLKIINSKSFLMIHQLTMWGMGLFSLTECPLLDYWRVKKKNFGCFAVRKFGSNLRQKDRNAVLQFTNNQTDNMLHTFLSTNCEFKFHLKSLLGCHCEEVSTRFLVFCFLWNSNLQ